MHYREIQPIPSLAAFVECFWTLESDASVEPAQPERLLPDGCVELILNFGDCFREHKDDGRQEPQPRHLLVGQMTQPVLIAPTGLVELLGIRFHPGGTFPFFRIPMKELTNQIVDLEALANEFHRDLVRAVEASPTLPLRIAAVERLLAERANHCPQSSRVMDLATRIVQRGGQVSIDQLAVAAGVSSRQLERRFLLEVGIGPETALPDPAFSASLSCRRWRRRRLGRGCD